MAAVITEERLFSTTGQLLARTTTPGITSLRAYRRALGTRVASVSRHRYDGQHGVCFRLYDGRLLIVLLGKPGPAVLPTAREGAAGSSMKRS
jgi:hypothetical protein